MEQNYDVLTRVYQEENEAENAYEMLLENGFSENALTVTPYNPLNSITDLQGNTNTEFIGDGSRDAYILSITLLNDGDGELVRQLLDAGDELADSRL